MIPKGLKIGDTFKDEGLRGLIPYKVVGFDGQGNYISELITEPETVVPVEAIEEELPFTIPDDELVEEEQPVVEEVKEEKKPAPKKKTTSKKKATKKK